MDPRSNRDIAVDHTFRALHLSRSLVCEELDKPLSPQTKASLISLLNDCAQLEVTPALLRQLGDKRPAIEPPDPPVIAEGGLKGHAFRVCDVAYDVLVNNAHNREIADVSLFMSDKRKDEIIQENLPKLKLAPP